MVKYFCPNCRAELAEVDYRMCYVHSGIYKIDGGGFKDNHLREEYLSKENMFSCPSCGYFLGNSVFSAYNSLIKEVEESD